MNSAIYWMRRDLRWDDNSALTMACSEYDKVYPVFIFDENILLKLPEDDHRVHFIFKVLQKLQQKYPLSIYYGDPTTIIPKLVKAYKVDKVFTNEDYEAYALKRDKEVTSKVASLGAEFAIFRDHINLKATEVLNNSNAPYKVFTPYKNKWLDVIHNNLDRFSEMKPKRIKEKLAQFKDGGKISALKDIDFKPSSILLPSIDAKATWKKFIDKIVSYEKGRDFPREDATSKLSVHLRFGTISQRQLWRYLYENDLMHSVWASELIWREFFLYLIQHFPEMEKLEFQAKYRGLKWIGDKKLLTKWKQGMTGFPIIDAGMRELNQTGFMHNRVRMIVASFLTKNLLLDWRLGERYFSEKLFDFECAVNVGNWQWASSTGCDAQPYFRVFNPISQAKKFDTEGEYIKHWCPELKDLPLKYLHEPYLMSEMDKELLNFKLGKTYPYPCVDLKETRQRAIDFLGSV